MLDGAKPTIQTDSYIELYTNFLKNRFDLHSQLNNAADENRYMEIKRKIETEFDLYAERMGYKLVRVEKDDNIVLDASKVDTNTS
ncbi:MAG TPA: hypothetical protein VJH34_03550 [archaeon]|nr:hypothetical protein [archaeon]